MPSAEPRLRCDRVSKAFPGVQALDDVSLEVGAGSVHALVGENGAGKSTLMKILSGAIQADRGQIAIDGETARITDARAAQRCGIAIVYQELNLVADLSVSENIFLGRWSRSRVSGFVDFPALHRRAEDLLATLGVALPVRKLVGGLTVAQQQLVEIAKALSLDARILILDEPSAVLTAHELVALFRLIRDLKARGVSVIYISHRLDEVFEIADTVTVLRDGKHISTRPVNQTNRDRLIVQMVGRSLGDEFPSRGHEHGEVTLRMARLSAPGRFSDVSFEVSGGEVFALTGLVGSGRSSVAKAAFGAVPVSAGAVRVGDRVGPFRSPREAMAAGVVMLPEDRKQQGLLLERSLRENVSLANPKAVATAGFVRNRRERALVSDMAADLQIRAVSIESLVETLSGGNQQKVLLARWMCRPHRVVIFDEPTRGIDVGAKQDIYALINRLTEEGSAVVMISSELPEVIGMADRIGVMHAGRLTGILDNGCGGVTQEQIMRLASGETIAA
ncbi:MAG: sugar ABC transporter ATP-binding protein [Phycisphaerae bacterium]|jgi:ribose transport system ATP-binding protein